MPSPKAYARVRAWDTPRPQPGRGAVLAGERPLQSCSRTVRHLVLVLPLVAACDGVLREKVGQSDVDAGGLTLIPPPMCAEPATPTDSGDCTGGGAPGDDCLACHSQGGGGRPFVFAGTLYDRAGVAPAAGATVVLQDAVGNVSSAITHANGNFFVVDGFVMYPAKAFATLCPDVTEMISPVDETTGANCNTGGCHTAGFRASL